jgi:hypothetical protein
MAKRNNDVLGGQRLWTGQPKALDWSAGIGWGWTTALVDDECTTEWPWGWVPVEVRSSTGPVIVGADGVIGADGVRSNLLRRATCAGTSDEHGREIEG